MGWSRVAARVASLLASNVRRLQSSKFVERRTRHTQEGWPRHARRYASFGGSSGTRDLDTRHDTRHTLRINVTCRIHTSVAQRSHIHLPVNTLATLASRQKLGTSFPTMRRFPRHTPLGKSAMPGLADATVRATVGVRRKFVLHVNIEQECLRDECDWTGSEGLREFPEAGTLIYFIFSTWYDFARINGERELPLFFFSFLSCKFSKHGLGMGLAH